MVLIAIILRNDWLHLYPTRILFLLKYLQPTQFVIPSGCNVPQQTYLPTRLSNQQLPINNNRCGNIPGTKKAGLKYTQNMHYNSGFAILSIVFKLIGKLDVIGFLLDCLHFGK